MNFFDIDRIEKMVDELILASKKYCQLISVSFSSIGESVIPVKNGKAIGLPLLWYEDNLPVSKKAVKFIEQYTGFEYTGVHKSATYSLYKMIWMQEHLLDQTPDYWLPVSSYLVFRKTKHAIWDTSQASRSYLYNIHKKEWIGELVKEFLHKTPGEIGTIGTYCGSCDGIIYGLGGHDHYVGLYGVYELHGGGELFYDSMGSSSVMAIVKKDPCCQLGGLYTYSPGGGCLVTGFSEQEYIINRSIDYYGRIVACLISIKGITADYDFYKTLNFGITKNIQEMTPCLVACNNNIKNMKADIQGIHFLCIREQATFEEMMLGAYYYMALGTAHMFRSLSKFCSDMEQSMPYYAGGGMIDNEFFMKLKATALGREITTLKTPEISSLGAAVSAVNAAGRKELLPYMKAQLLAGKTYHPDKHYESFIREIKVRYEELCK